MAFKLTTTMSKPVADPTRPRKRTLVVELRCSICGYGAVVSSAPERCPMCGGSAWEPARRGRVGSGVRAA